MYDSFDNTYQVNEIKSIKLINYFRIYVCKKNFIVLVSILHDTLFIEQIFIASHNKQTYFLLRYLKKFCSQ